ncbi:hypothetical protein ACT80S_11025 [Ramlibacter sp. MAHUQ-53]
MTMKRRSLVTGAVALTAAPAFAQFGGLLGGARGGSGGGNVDADVAAFLTKSFNIEKTLSKAYLAIAAAYLKEGELAKTRTLFEEVGKLTEPKEAGAKFQEVQQSALAELKRLGESKDLEAQTKALSAEKQQQVAKGVGNFLLGVFQSKDLVSTGQSLVSSVASNPMSVGKVLPVKDSLTRLGRAAELAGATLPAFVNVLKGVNVSVAPASTSSTEEKVDSI